MPAPTPDQTPPRPGVPASSALSQSSTQASSSPSALSDAPSGAGSTSSSGGNQKQDKRSQTEKKADECPTCGAALDLYPEDGQNEHKAHTGFCTREGKRVALDQSEDSESEPATPGA